MRKWSVLFFSILLVLSLSADRRIKGMEPIKLARWQRKTKAIQTAHQKMPVS